MPTPALRAISSSDVDSPPSANASRAAASTRSWLRLASARLGRVCAVAVWASIEIYLTTGGILRIVPEASSESPEAASSLDRSPDFDKAIDETGFVGRPLSRGGRDGDLRARALPRAFLGTR